MTLDSEACYRALASRDSRFDGLFFVGVQSTRIYCRSVCTARTPKPQNCHFFANAASAERAGFRPCLLCRPELAPGRSRVDAVGRLASIAVRRIEDGALMDTSLTEFAEELGVTSRHLRRAVVEHYGVSPVELLQTQRLLMAKRLLMDTNLPIGEVAMTSGFSSLRRFNAAFKERYRLNPTAIRKARHSPPSSTCAPPAIAVARATRPPSEGMAANESIVLEVGYRPPYDWESMLAFLEPRAVSGVEAVIEGRYVRAVSLGRDGNRCDSGWIAVSPSNSRNALRVEVSSSLARSIPQILRRVRRLFDTSSEPAAIATVLGDLAAAKPGLRVPGAFDGFEAATRAILGQQITVAGARTLAGRLAARFGEPIESPYLEVDRAFPKAETIGATRVDDIGSLGVVGKRAKALIAIAHAIVTGELRPTPGSDVDATIGKPRRIHGILLWTAQSLAMRGLSYPDAFPNSDLGVLKALGTRDPAEALALADRWRPWRAYATLHLWSGLSAKH